MEEGPVPVISCYMKTTGGVRGKNLSLDHVSNVLVVTRDTGCTVPGDVQSQAPRDSGLTVWGTNPEPDQRPPCDTGSKGARQ